MIPMIRPDDIEFVAHRMCEAMGVDPSHRIETTVWEGMTAYERVNNPYRFCDHPVTMAAWQAMIPHAEKALAARAALAALDIRHKQLERLDSSMREFMKPTTPEGTAGSQSRS